LCMVGLDATPTSRCSCVHCCCCCCCCCSREHGVTTYRSTRQGCPNMTVVTTSTTPSAHYKLSSSCYCIMEGDVARTGLLHKYTWI
jgi:hypothetical protein